MVASKELEEVFDRRARLGDANDAIFYNSAEYLDGPLNIKTGDGNEGNDRVTSIDIRDDEGVTPDQVFGGWGEDFLIVDQGDTVTTGVGSDRVAVSMYETNDIGESFDAVEITDFVPGQDVLQLYDNSDLLNAADGEDDPISVVTNGEDTSVRINGVEVVRLTGVTGLMRADIIVDS